MLIKIENVYKKYQMGDSTVKALDNVSLNIADGEFITIVGASGSGKTTLMNILGCLDVPTEGKYYFNGNDIEILDNNKLSDLRNDKIGFVFQGFNLIPSLTAYENVELPLIYRKVPKSRRKPVVETALTDMGILERKNHLPTELSGGQQQRVAIARAIATDPDVILADEPCGNLDSKTGKDVMGILYSLNRKGKTIILITHDEKIASSANRLIRISDGRIIK